MSAVDGRRPTTGVLALLELLQDHRRLTGAELAERLGVHPRTVRRYAARLVELGVPVAAERGRNGGYRLRSSHRLPPLMLSDDEALAVALGLLASRAMGVVTATTGPDAEAAFAKILRVVPDTLRERIAAVSAAVGLAVPDRDGPTPRTAAVLTLASAADQRRRVRLTYVAGTGERSTRELDPHGLVVRRGRWYVTGYDHRRSEIRTFRVDRIAALQMLDEGFTAPEHVDPATYADTSLPRVPRVHAVQVVLRAPLADVRRRLPTSMATLTEVPEGVEMTFEAESLAGAAQMLAGLGWPFVIRRPEVLRVEVRALATSLLSYADEVLPARSTV